jgi:pimeloyl-ACP methyl ester carboxylesterase
MDKRRPIPASAIVPPTELKLGSAQRYASRMLLETPTGTLTGTLQLPTVEPPFPVALIISGSGPTDRDGNSPMLAGHNDSLKMLAESLAALGIASLRYDKRGIGESAAAGGDESTSTFDLLVDDASLWLKTLAGDDRFDRTIVIGHSEGSLIGMITVSRVGAGAFVSLEGAGRPAADVLRSQLATQLPPNLMQEVGQVLSELEEGRTVLKLPAGIDAVPAVGQALFRQSVQPYLVSWFRYDPLKVIAEFAGPSLIVQGTTDLQVPVADGEALAAAATDGTLALIEGMNHVLKLAPADPQTNVATYSDPSLPLAPELVEALNSFLRKLGS